MLYNVMLRENASKSVMCLPTTRSWSYLCTLTVPSTPVKLKFNMVKEKVVVYTDGACSGNGQRGAQAGYGVYCPSRPEIDRCGSLSPNEAHTNQRAELTGIREALRATRDIPAPVEIRTDSAYGIGCATNWGAQWESKGWNVNKCNLDIVKDIVHETKNRDHPVTFKHVKGHSGEPGNEQADKYATYGARSGNNY